MPSSASGPRTTSRRPIGWWSWSSSSWPASASAIRAGQVRLGMALEEAFRTAILRGNLELTPELLLAVSGHHEQSQQLARRPPPGSALRGPSAGRPREGDARRGPLCDHPRGAAAGHSPSSRRGSRSGAGRPGRPQPDPDAGLHGRGRRLAPTGKSITLVKRKASS